MATALAALVPDLTAVDYGDTLALLAKHGVKTGPSPSRARARTDPRLASDVDLLFLDAGTVPDCPAQMLRALQGLISGWLVPTPTSGTALLAAVTSRPRISSVLPGLDVMLGGGFEPGSVVEITGGRGSRKSLFALNILLLHMLLHTASRATFVDTTNSFDAQICLDIVLFHIPRLQEQGQFLSTSNTPSANASDPHAIAISVLNRLTISACFTVAKTFEAIESTLRTKDYGEGKLELVVIDQVETLVGGATLSAASAKGHAVMIAFLKRLHSLSCDPENPLVTFVRCPTPRPG